ncbi:translation initiation factor IF-2 [Jiulongibacter sediminis]|uniref:Translation initiation factor IF-2 n=1 Tax=Jiulongibacter sediminis TaxID=1605367 RepID=A0A0N8HA38_9BACT|nr:translation initiation factor IF-2 [Jiulongibacter sediminis]KPM49092.1 translation initiation factor IF-2 [Jiulongibacter sediminis]TBX26150.1 translation initiation factor IF-2 [Jiulongibacter sediminis]
MAETTEMRLNLVARKLNVSWTQVVDTLVNKGHEIDRKPNAKIGSDLLEVLEKEYDTNVLLGAAPAAASPSEKPKTHSSDEDILYFREEPEVKKEEKAPERVKFEHNITGPKVVGKIDLDKKPAPKSIEPEEEKPEVKAETPAPEPVQESKPAPAPEEVKVEEPVKEQAAPKAEEAKSEAPKAEEKEEVKEPVKEEKAEAKAEAPKEEKKEEAKEPENQLIKAKGDKLAGLKVLGKIELPVEKKPESKEDRKKRKRKRVSRLGNLTDITDQQYFKKKESEGGGGGRSQNQKGNNKNKGKGPAKGQKEELTQEDIKDSIKATMAKMKAKGPDFGAKHRREKRRTRAEQAELDEARVNEESTILKVTEFISASELASMMDVSVNDVISTCMQLGMFVSINQRLDAESIQLIAMEYNYEVEFISAEEEIQADNLEIVDDEEDLKPRAPIVTIMGHVDHGKTSLLDYIRTTKVASGEAGGITQHIGAYNVEVQEGENKGKSVTFLDTPGHEAFTAMRARGAKVTDVVIIVISADDSVMPQTREAINHAKNANVPIVFALNKIDKPGANPDKIREDLSKENILVESWGGKYQEQEVSAKTGIGIDELLDKVLLEAELLELTANPDRKANGAVIEASLDKGRGYVSTILVEAGTLNVGDIILAGQYFGRVRAMINDVGERIKTAGPSTPVQILGLPGAPQAGDKFNVMESDREAREIANKREQIIREQSIRAKRHITLDEIGRRKAIGSFKELSVIVKGDVDGSVEALSDSLLKLSTDEVQVKIIHKGVGQISESDVLLASAADAIILGFQVRPSANARRIADTEEIEIRLYSVIYDAINEIKDAMEGLLAPTEEEVITGNIEVREIFKISKIGTIAGSYVLDGYVKRQNSVRVIREGIVLHDGKIAQLKRFKDDVGEVRAGYECGINIEKFNDLQVGDIIESYEIREIKRSLK